MAKTDPSALQSGMLNPLPLLALLAQPPVVSVVPAPASVTMAPGTFRLDSTAAVRAGSASLAESAAFLREALAPLAARADAVPGGPAITLAIDRHGPAESYRLVVTPGAVRITGSDPDGLFWGIQTFRQLLPPAFERADARTSGAWAIPAVTIADAPQYRWRGLHLDVSRHFFSVAEVERQIDLAARYKLNVFHWHLTDDQGWRIAIRKYPRLTEVGAWRTEADGARSGGFYTQAEVREVVAFARRRHVMVVPEIEMPGHASAAIAAYPWLGCPNRPIDVPVQWGVHEDILCVGQPRVLRFLADVLDEVVPLFPSRWFHIGGDEVPKTQWKACAECRARMKTERLKTFAQLQSWFTRRMTAMLRARGKTLVGWDEIMEGGIPPGAVIQAWRGDRQTNRAARTGHDVIASPGDVYLDRDPAGLPLTRVYDFDPRPKGLLASAARRILGAEAAAWTERITDANLDPMVYPRLLGFAEAVWRAGPRDRAAFLARLDRDQDARLAALGVTGGPRDRIIAALRTGYDSATGRITVAAETGMPGIEVRAVPAAMPDSGPVSVTAFLNGRPLPGGRRFMLEPHLAAGRPVRLATPPGEQYPGTGAFNLTDRALGSNDHNDGFWQGWWGPALDATIDLGRVEQVRSVEGSFLQQAPSWILLPRTVTVWFSTDGADWREAGSEPSGLSPAENAPTHRRLGVRLAEPAPARFVRLKAENFGPLPADHPGAGRPAWIFADEIIVR